MISEQQVKHVAKLARLGLSDKEIEKMQKELSVILDYIDLLKKCDVSKIKPTFHSISIENVMREDHKKEEDPQTVNKLLDEAPSKEKGYIKVKEILK
jgi:aspartyl-tRNA(Asn)/glutamyl-tRNA(Gln) amidotransferase subunit C